MAAENLVDVLSSYDRTCETKDDVAHLQPCPKENRLSLVALISSILFEKGSLGKKMKQRYRKSTGRSLQGEQIHYC